MKNTIHIIPHSHWDREWYMPFESHRMLLIELIDNIIELMESDPSYTNFHLDGKTIDVEDYLEIRPQMRDRLMKLIREDRLQIGPWYVLQDEYLTSGEANVRNMLEGLHFCRENGIEPVMTGYLPDSFGNISQMPQILCGFGIDNAVFGRGVGAILSDNRPDSVGQPTEYNWTSPDGSSVMAIKFIAWYNDANELPVDPEPLKKMFGDLAKRAEAQGVTPHFLFMNGCDHQPVQKDLGQAITAARELFPEYEIKQSNFKDYIASVRPYADKFTPLAGEMISQYTNGYGTLVNTASTHIPLKQQNHTVQNLLTRAAEPFGVMAAMEGDAYRSDTLRYAWRKLMQNHPHDSICSCSCDGVAKEMAVRFDKAQQVAEYAANEAQAFLLSKIDAQGDKNICVFHTALGTQAVTVKAALTYAEEQNADTLALFDGDGKQIPAKFTALGKQFSYTLPKDRFRIPAYLYTYEVEFLAEVTGFGYTTYRVGTSDAQAAANVRLCENGAENRFLRMTVNPDGSFDVLEKESGRVFAGMNYYEDTGDCGESYNYRQSEDGVTVTTKGAAAEISLLEQTPFRITYRVIHRVELPAGCVDKKRTAETVLHTVTTDLTVTADSRAVSIRTAFTNASENHRLRAVFPCGIAGDKDIADGQFDVLNREIVPWKGWENPSDCQRCQAFFGMADDAAGALVASRGLYEYEVLYKENNALALTLLRAVGEVGDWGVFPTPDMQLKRDMVLEYAFIPYAAAQTADAYRTGYTFSGGIASAKQLDRQNGTLPAAKQFFNASGDHAVFSAFKPAEDGDGYILRLYNPSAAPREWSIALPAFGSAQLVNLDEKEPSALDCTDGTVRMTAAPKKIYTFRLK